MENDEENTEIAAAKTTKDNKNAELPSKSVHSEYDRLLKELCTIQKVNESNDIRAINYVLKNLFTMRFLPGYTTPEKLFKFDEASRECDLLEDNEYANLLDVLCQLFNQHWPRKCHNDDHLVLGIFKIDYSLEWIMESFMALQNRLKEIPTTVADALSFLMEDHEFLTLAFYYGHKDGEELERLMLISNQTQTHQREIIKLKSLLKEFLELVINLPNRIANHFQDYHQIPNIFMPQNYLRVLFKHFLQTIWLIDLCEKCNPQERLNENKRKDGKFLADLLHRIVVDFCANFMETNSPLSQFLQIMRFFGHCTPGIGILIRHQILQRFESQHSASAYRISVTMLNHLIDLNDLLGDAVSWNTTWNICLLQKITLQTSLKSNEAMINLIKYLITVDILLVKKLFKQFLSIWSRRVTIQKQSMAEHLDLSKWLLLSGKAILREKNGKKVTNIDFLEIRKQLHIGLRCHLESSDIVVRYSGMKVAEFIFNVLVDLEEMNHDQDAQEENYLHFDYGCFQKHPRGKGVLEDFDNTLQQLEVTVSTLNDDTKIQEENVMLEERLQRLWNVLMAEFESDKNYQTDLKKEQTNSKQVEKKLSCENEEESKKMNSIIQSSKEPLDSDDDDYDDLRPYDLSNDTSNLMDKCPKFLLDIIDTLSNRCDDWEIFQATLMAAESLIRNQLPESDAHLAVELLRLFMGLEMLFYYENFEETKFLCCVAITTAHPIPCAEYMCGEFHSSNAHCGVGKRIFILQVLSAAARELSHGKTNTSNNDVKCFKSPVLSNRRKYQFIDEHRERMIEAQKIIRKRLAEKTRRFCSKRKSNTNSLEEMSANRFHKCVKTFFYGIVNGPRTKQMIYAKYDSVGHDIEILLLINFLHTLSVFVIEAENSPLIGILAREVFDLCTYIRYHSEQRVRLATIELVGVVLIATPTYLLSEHLDSHLAEVRRWLMEINQSPFVAGGDPSEECRKRAKEILCAFFSFNDNEVHIN